MNRKAFVLRINPGGHDRVAEALEESEAIVGWSGARGLIDATEWNDFREIVHKTHYSDRSDYRAAGRASGDLWRFLKAMDEDSYILVPHGNSFYIGVVTGPAFYREEKCQEDSAYRRPVKWLNGSRPVPRHQVPAELYARMKIRGTSADASEFLKDIENLLERLQADQPTDFQTDLRAQMIAVAVDRLKRGFVNERAFERIIGAVLARMGARVRVIEDRRMDKGADLVATFTLGRTTEIVVAVQAKFYKPEPPISTAAVDELHKGIAAEGADLGWLVTTGRFSDEAEARRAGLLEDHGIRIDFMDAEDLATLIVEAGFGIKSLTSESVTE